MHTKDEYIAVFDSGVGGISVLRELVRQLPNERFLYYGDNLNAPYGTRTTQQVRQLTLDAAAMLLSRGTKALVVACNTATAAAIEDLRQAYPDTVIVGIEPALKVAADHYPRGRVGVMATPLTLKEEKFSHLSQRFSEMTVVLLPAPGLVELIEEGCDDAALESFLTPMLAPYRDKLDAVVLGCTHYPFAAHVIGKLLGQGTEILDGSRGTAAQTRRRLAQENLLSDGQGSVQIESSAPSGALLRRCMQLLERTER